MIVMSHHHCDGRVGSKRLHLQDLWVQYLDEKRGIPYPFSIQPATAPVSIAAL